MKNNININDKTDLYCDDCKSVTRQKYKGIYNDGNHLFICQECGCENTEEDKELKNNVQFKNCLSCANSASEECPNGDILHCMIHNKIIVSDNDYCDEWN